MEVVRGAILLEFSVIVTFLHAVERLSQHFSSQLKLFGSEARSRRNDGRRRCWSGFQGRS